MIDFLRLIDVNAGGLRLKKGQAIFHLNLSFGLVFPSAIVFSCVEIGPVPIKT